MVGKLGLTIRVNCEQENSPIALKCAPLVGGFPNNNFTNQHRLISDSAMDSKFNSEVQCNDTVDELEDCEEKSILCRNERLIFGYDECDCWKCCGESYGKK